ncbi:MAG: aldehyde dehydrogenase family protein [Bacteroidales bacterium]|jgi:aldehyde dehydrogenase (NAD+)|nr:aldehyde dehydrogenase family protein [Bacteroidales bacterium]
MKFELKNLGIGPVNPGVSTGIAWLETHGDETISYSPVDATAIAKVKNATLDDYEHLMFKAQEAYLKWRIVPAPKRGEVVRQIGEALRKKKEELGYLVSLEMGKIYEEGLGEVQEMIDICDFSVGQSRLLNGATMHSERPFHRMYDQYHPLGIVGIITSYNFPVAVWGWNSMLAAIAGDVIIWKPSSKTPLCAIAVQKIIAETLRRNNVPEGVFNLIITKSSVLGDNFAADKRIPLISVTGSTKVGKKIAGIVGNRLGKTILELGGNNAVIISQHANLDMTLQSVVFGSVGTCGQRCTSTRRLIVHESVFETVKERLVAAYQSISDRIGNPLDKDTLIGPLMDGTAVKNFLHAIEEVRKEGGTVVFGGTTLRGEKYHSDNYVMPAIVEAENHYKTVQEETFAPIVYLIKYSTIEEAISLNNNVPQGLSSCIFTEDLIEAEKFLSETGSDCGIANVNLGTSGAEIGGAFGGEKDTGGGRESGSDAWKAYMRRQTNTLNFSGQTALAQGITFDF